MKKITLLIFSALILLSGIIPVMAHCPLCTAAAGTGVAIARNYGVDDSIVGLMLGALIASSGLWISNLLRKKNIKFPLQEAVLVIVSFLLLVIPLYYKQFYTPFEMVKSMPGHHGMTGLGVLGLAEFGVDKLLFGTILGTLAIWFTFKLSDSIKESRGKRLFPYQGLAFMLIALVILTLFLWANITPIA